ncbi:hypothetical protein BpHYR1_034399 [Brachionus plicatilis]|uniref:Uncharacterized protein n=1 Tax=Brachionus plicatilis TaxID=10195 RepID=A0A3M7SVH6_BRAPC|nr:hypothetical protein BpHYR1_034399 [Brachionus plicatilis]
MVREIVAFLAKKLILNDCIEENDKLWKIVEIVRRIEIELSRRISHLIIFLELQRSFNSSTIGLNENFESNIM